MYHGFLSYLYYITVLFYSQYFFKKFFRDILEGYYVQKI
nr:MAG TPA: hypothetical protein [Caudoviricetes sp.]